MEIEILDSDSGCSVPSVTEVSWQGDVAALPLPESEPWRGLGDAISIDSEDSEQVPSEIDVLDFMCPMMLEDDLEPEPACSQREDFIEVFSQPRLVPKAQELALGFNASKSIDILTGWDLLTEANQKATMEHFRSKKPRSCMLSPPCAMFSQLMNTNFPRMDPIVVKKRWKDALTLWHFALHICQFMMSCGAIFVLEHPTGASSRRLQETQQLLSTPGIYLVTFHQCRFGLKAPISGFPIRKSTRLMTNSPIVAQYFDRVFCTCQGPHKTIQGNEGPFTLSKYCEKYPSDLCEALLRAIAQQLAS